MAAHSHKRDGPNLPLPEPMPVGEVSDSDWQEWDDSVAFQDSQYPEPSVAPLQAPLVSPQTEDEMFDPFTSVHKNSS